MLSTAGRSNENQFITKRKGVKEGRIFIRQQRTGLEAKGRLVKRGCSADALDRIQA